MEPSSQTHAPEKESSPPKYPKASLDTLYNRTSFPCSKVMTTLIKGVVKIIKHKLLDFQIY